MYLVQGFDVRMTGARRSGGRGIYADGNPVLADPQGVLRMGAPGNGTWDEVLLPSLSPVSVAVYIAPQCAPKKKTQKRT